MRRRIVGLVFSPSAPDAANPSRGQGANGVRVTAAARERASESESASLCVDAGGPGSGVTRVVGKAGERSTQPVVVGLTDRHGLGLARRTGHGSNAGLGGKLLVTVKALTCDAQQHALSTAAGGRFAASADRPPWTTLRCAMPTTLNHRKVVE